MQVHVAVDRTTDGGRGRASTNCLCAALNDE